MIFKRLSAIILTLILIVQLAACKSNSNLLVDDASSTQQSSIAQEEVSSEDLTSSSEEESSEISEPSDQNNSQTQDTASSNKQDTNEIPQDNSTVTSSASKPEENNKPQEDNKEEFLVKCNHGSSDPYQGMSESKFYANYTISCCNLDASYRSKHGFLSGSLEVPGQYAKDAANQPKLGDKYVRNTATVYIDNGNTYVVIDANGKEVMRIHKAGAYITLEEVAAYMYAFGGSGQIPANYTTKKSTKPSSSIWGKYLRVNHTYFSGDTDKYPYEPELPNIKGCGGTLQYYEMDIGTTGTSTPGYAPKVYNDGSKINRGAARIVYARQDLNRNGIYENNEIYIFYTHNHYNDFREYLNYYGGWGKMFGNVTGGGAYSSTTNAKPTPYVVTAYADFLRQ